MSNNRRRRPPQSTRPKAPAANALAAEAAGGVLEFEFRGHRFEIDTSEVDFAKAAVAIQIASRGSAGLMTAAGMMVDAFEACLGKDNLVRIYELAPDLFSSASAQEEFWEAFAKVTIGGSAGESPAS